MTMRRAGQAAIESVIAIIVVLTFVVCTARVWGWMDRSFVGREQGYQQTRVTAGSNRPGYGNQYAQPLLNVFGPSTEFIPPGGYTGGGGGTGICPAGQAFMQQAMDARAEAQGLRDEAQAINVSIADEMGVFNGIVAAGDALMAEAARLDAEAEEYRREHQHQWWWSWYWTYRQMKREAERTRDRAYAKYAEGESYYNAHLRDPMAQMRAKQEQADALMDQADALEQQAREACL